MDAFSHVIFVPNMDMSTVIDCLSFSIFYSGGLALCLDGTVDEKFQLVFDLVIYTVVCFLAEISKGGGRVRVCLSAHVIVFPEKVL